MAQLDSIPFKVPNINRIAIASRARPFFGFSFNDNTLLLKVGRHFGQIRRCNRQAIMIQVARAVADGFFIGPRKQIDDHTVMNSNTGKEHFAGAELLYPVGLQAENVDVKF